MSRGECVFRGVGLGDTLSWKIFKLKASLAQL